MLRSAKITQVHKPSTKAADDFGVFGKRFPVQKPLMQKQIRLIPHEGEA